MDRKREGMEWNPECKEAKKARFLSNSITKEKSAIVINCFSLVFQHLKINYLLKHRWQYLQMFRDVPQVQFLNGDVPLRINVWMILIREYKR